MQQICCVLQSYFIYRNLSRFFHRLVRNVEINSHVVGLLLAFLLVKELIIYTSISYSSNGIIRTISDALHLDAAFHTGLFGSMVHTAFDKYLTSID